MWNRCDESMPEDGWYIVYCEGLKRAMYYAKENNCWIWYCESGESEVDLDEVSHYMNLPDDPIQ